jgi:hypothetical protein
MHFFRYCFFLIAFSVNFPAKLAAQYIYSDIVNPPYVPGDGSIEFSVPGSYNYTLQGRGGGENLKISIGDDVVIKGVGLPYSQYSNHAVRLLVDGYTVQNSGVLDTAQTYGIYAEADFELVNNGQIHDIAAPNIVATNQAGGLITGDFFIWGKMNMKNSGILLPLHGTLVVETLENFGDGYIESSVFSAVTIQKQGGSVLNRDSAKIIGYNHGIEITNRNAVVENNAFVSGVNSGVFADKTFDLANGTNGYVTGNLGVYARGSTKIVNSGVIFGNEVGLAISQSADVINEATGSILSDQGTALRSENLKLKNSGKIVGKDYGLWSLEQTTVVNSGLIEGGISGVFQPLQYTPVLPESIEEWGGAEISIDEQTGKLSFRAADDRLKVSFLKNPIELGVGTSYGVLNPTAKTLDVIGGVGGVNVYSVNHVFYGEADSIFRPSGGRSSADKFSFQTGGYWKLFNIPFSQWNVEFTSGSEVLRLAYLEGEWRIVTFNDPLFYDPRSSNDGLVNLTNEASGEIRGNDYAMDTHQIQLVNRGLITGVDGGIRTFNSATIQNHGVIHSTEGIALEAGTTADITNTNLIEGGTGGLHSVGTLAIVNEGSILTETGTALKTGDSAVVTNSGTVRSVHGIALEAGAEADITNTNLIEGGTGGLHSVGALTIRNEGDILTDTDTALKTGESALVTNSGTVKSTEGIALEADAEADITNTNLIEGGTGGLHSVGALTIRNEGDILTDTGTALKTGESALVTNSGTVKSTVGIALEAGTTADITNTNLIEGGTGGLHSVGALTIRNEGDILTDTGTALKTGESALVTNSGTVKSTVGIALEAGTTADITNTNLIQGGVGGLHSVGKLTIRNEGGILTDTGTALKTGESALVTNSGTVKSVEGIALEADAEADITNTNLIQGGTGGLHSVGTLTIGNEGSIFTDTGTALEDGRKRVGDKQRNSEIHGRHCPGS